MYCYNDRTYCHRSNIAWCQINKVEPCNNILCNRHCWEIPKSNNIPVCYSDFSERCNDYFSDLIPAKCPFCGKYDVKVTYHIKCRYFAKQDNKDVVDYIFRVSCKNCKSQTGEIRMNYIKQGDESCINLGKLAAIWKWNGYGERTVDKVKAEAEIKSERKKKAEYEEAVRFFRQMVSRECD